MSIPSPLSVRQTQEKLQKLEAEQRIQQEESESKKPLSSFPNPERQGGSNGAILSVQGHSLVQVIFTYMTYLQCECGERFESLDEAKSHLRRVSHTKKPFVRKPHLTQRPLAGNKELQKLRDSLPQNKRQNHKGGRPPKHPKKS